MEKKNMEQEEAMKESRKIMEEALSLEDNAALITLLITQEK